MTYIEAITRDFEDCISQMVSGINKLQTQCEVLESLDLQGRLNKVERFKQIDDLSEKIKIIELLKKEEEFIKEALSRVGFPLGYPFIEKSISQESTDEQISKVTKRIPTWFRKYFNGLAPYNGTILVKFLELSNENTRPIKRYDLEQACRYTPNFTNNYNNMRNMSSNNHGKVFEEANGEVTLWQPVANIVLEAYNKAKSLQNSGNSFSVHSQIRGSEMTDKQFDDAFTAAGGWFLLTNVEEIIALNNKHYTTQQIAEIMFEKGFDSSVLGTNTRVSSILRLVRGNRIIEAIEKVRDSVRINSEHPQAKSLAIEILQRISH